MNLPISLTDPQGTRLTLRRAWPRSPTHLLLDYAADDGRAVAGQWFADPAELRAAAAATPAPARACPAAGVLVQPAGADARLAAVAGLLGRPGAGLLSHRPERRAVLRLPAASVPELAPPGGMVYVKVVRPSRAKGIHAAAQQVLTLAGGALDVPSVLGHDEARGLLALAELPGPTLLEIGRTAGDDAVAAVWREAGQGIRRLHDGPIDGPDLPRHDAAAEHALTVRWLRLAESHRVLPPVGTAALARLVGDPPGPAGLLHRDLHDQQLIGRRNPRDGWRIGVLDVDTLAVGERALDVANLQAHLVLRALQHELDPTAAHAAGEALLEGLDPDPRTVARLTAYRTASLLRLAAVYAFRPHWQHLTAVLLDAALTS